MNTKKSSTHVTRREFVTRVGTIGTGLATASWLSRFSPSHAHAAVDLSGSGSVIVGDGGGAWGAAKRAAYFEPFEATTGIKVIANPAGGAAKLRAGAKAGAPGYDAYSFSGGQLGTFMKEGLLEPINYRWFDPADKAAFAPVSTHEYGVPSLFFSLVVAYDPAKFASKPPKTWADFWDTNRYPGSRTLATGSLGPGGGLFELALLADGVAPAKLYPLDLDRAFRSLDRIRPAVTKFWQGGAEPVQLLVDSQVALASAWNGRVADLQSKGARIASSWDQAILQYDYWVVPKGAKNVENAMKFLAFVSQPRPQARFAELITYGPTNSRAFEFIRPERAALLPTAPALRDMQVVQDYSWWNSEAVPGKTNQQLAIERWEQWVTGNK